jgi:endonuclease YncB( thermonuclease family)
MLTTALLAVAQVATGQSFTCNVIRVHDGDGPLTCANGARIRIAGVQSPDFESAEPCRVGKPGYVCDDGRARAAKRVTEGLTLGKRLTCSAVDHSWNRVVARCWLPDNRSLSCAVVARGAARRWESYWRRYRMGDCK